MLRTSDKNNMKNHMKFIRWQALLCTNALLLGHRIEYMDTVLIHLHACHAFTKMTKNCHVRYKRIKCLLLNHNNVIMVLFVCAKNISDACKNRSPFSTFYLHRLRCCTHTQTGKSIGERKAKTPFTWKPDGCSKLVAHRLDKNTEIH